jgi:hypothetical protein
VSSRQAIRSLSIREVAEALKSAPPEAWPKLKAALLATLDALIAALPDTFRPGLQALRAALEVAATVPVDLLAQVLAAIKGAVLTMDFGPATGDDSDLA